jgi:hypothetical protein
MSAAVLVREPSGPEPKAPRRHRRTYRVRDSGKDTPEGEAALALWLEGLLGKAAND